MKWVPQNWRDTLSVALVIGLPVLWVWGNLPEMVLGATIAGWTLVVQFYYRKRTGESNS